ncbi:glucose-1-phosphate thymidylyltransferase [Helicobacter muridarum]|uniref:Glucose-1-phosphate thymidylyltransferase n=1 Tax=Helicobacter muridarum TaxID=216 RepID=A0A099TZ35_9HELI|nr:glucose-1-phosphate thymidylyltransferase RfbA [Helicobacter muridarum]TLE01085.1 glucose-1-phosphate thymidylyltransferase [Helicobacter muridarum]STQ85947.1 glucose-1-phosphate thymidylyltransferase [Helicobacter muridarum]
MKGIILAGGSGTRLYPTTQIISKQLLPIYDKPMIYYPLSVLMLANIREVLIISTPRDIIRFKEIFKDGKWLGMRFDYCIQELPNGLAEAFIIGKDFINDNNVCLILGDNIFYGQGFSGMLSSAKSHITKHGGGVIFGYMVNDPSQFGVVEFDKNKEVISLEEKPKNPRSNYAITGLYFYDNNVISYAKQIIPSKRGELEITDINKLYLQNGKLKVEIFGRGFAWLDTGTNDSLLDAGSFVQTIERRQGFKIACLEEIAYKNKWIDEETLLKRAKELDKSGYGKYLEKLLNLT